MSLTATDVNTGRPIVITIADQEKIIAGNLNSSMLFNFLMGIHTVVYLGTLHLYYTKRSPNPQRRIIIPAITALYTLCAFVCAIGWYSVDIAVINNGETRQSTFVASISRLVWIDVALIASQDIMLVISDGLLLWRCFHLWARSWRVIAFPLFLTVSEIALIIPVSYLSIYGAPTTFNNLSSTLLFISTRSTVTTTGLIGYRIYGATSTSSSSLTASSSKTRFRHIFHVLFESAALYAAVILLNAVVAVIPAAGTPNNPVAFMTFYVETMLPISAGMMPTILVARIITSTSADTEMASITHISGLQFQSQSQARRATASNLNLSRLTRSRDSDRRATHTIDLEVGMHISTAGVLGKSEEHDTEKKFEI